ncbi:MAG TPA: hypothetical protein VEQ10_19125 [Vicinamibacteria bacterium]|nr:hypothetical protein [Vicinamibacteria bacterium]
MDSMVDASQDCFDLLLCALVEALGSITIDISDSTFKAESGGPFGSIQLV